MTTLPRPRKPLAPDEPASARRTPQAMMRAEVANKPEPVDEDIFGGDNFRVPTGRGVLTAEEIEYLLRPDIPKDAFEPPKTVSQRPVLDFEDGGEATVLSGDALQLAAEMTVALRRYCKIDAVLSLSGAGYAPLSEIVSRQAAASVLVLFRDGAGLQCAGLTLDVGIVSAIVTIGCGGQPGQSVTRAPSSLDAHILEHMLAPLAQAIDPSFEIAAVETDRSAAFATLPPGKGTVADMACKIGPVEGRMIFASVKSVSPGYDHARAPDGMAAPVSAVITARIARISRPLSQLSDLKPGAVLPLGLPIDQPVEILSGGRDGQVIAEGDIGRKGARMAVRINKTSPALKG